jgi:hypothetical protein
MGVCRGLQPVVSLAQQQGHGTDRYTGSPGDT